MKWMIATIAATAILTTSAHAVLVSGDPSTDGWVLTGNSLEKGVYVTGSANYGFEAYSAGLTIQAGSNLEISEGTLSWLAGDTVLGVGGAFQSITAAEAGWAAFTGGAVNALLPAGNNPSALKLQAKFGTSAATWSTSTTAPAAGNGSSGSSSGGGRVQVRTSGWFGATAVTSGQTEPWTWAGNSGQLLVLDKADHILWRQGSSDISPDKRVARMIWEYDATSGHVSSWELLLNVSLLGRLYPTYSGLLPSIGDKTILTVQNGDSAYTDALVSIAEVPIPEPGTMIAGALLLLPFGLSTIRMLRKRHAA